MKIAIFGATSEIAKDLILSFSANDDHELVLFARRPQEVMEWLRRVNLSNRCSIHEFSSFKDVEKIDAILNFVGAGDPAKISELGNTILDITMYYDQLAVDYLKLNPHCRYIFMSSGAAYGSDFSEPANENTKATFSINKLGLKDWYGVSKFYAECRHRALPNLPIVDVRIFNYFSSTQNINAKYLMADILRAIRNNEVLQTSEENIVRDYLGPNDFHQLIEKILKAAQVNIAVDCYSKTPISKFELLGVMHHDFGLQYKVNSETTTIYKNSKLNYYSLNKVASKFGFLPCWDSLRHISQQVNLFF
jgi:nucleoside-diphosphate-sugar epimerase